MSEINDTLLSDRVIIFLNKIIEESLHVIFRPVKERSQPGNNEYWMKLFRNTEVANYDTVTINQLCLSKIYTNLYINGLVIETVVYWSGDSSKEKPAFQHPLNILFDKVKGRFEQSQLKDRLIAIEKAEALISIQK